MQRLFSVAKIGLFLDKYAPGLERRSGEEVKIVTLTLRVAGIDAKLAQAIDDGIGGDSNVRTSLFKSSQPVVRPHIDRVAFSLGCARQNLTVFPSPDTQDERLMLPQVKIAGTYARTQKDRNGYDFVFRGSFGPVGRDELEFIHFWVRSQQFVTFEESEPLLEEEPDGDDGTDADQKAQHTASAAPKPMWDDDATAKRAPAADQRRRRKNVNRKLHSHHGRKRTGRRG